MACCEGDPGSESDPEGGDDSSPAEESYRDMDVSPIVAMLEMKKD